MYPNNARVRTACLELWTARTCDCHAFKLCVTTTAVKSAIFHKVKADVRSGGGGGGGENRRFLAGR